MWANYYIEANKCECCGRFDLLHMCKLSSWRQPTFAWYEYLEEDWFNNMLGTKIQSIKDWKKISKLYKIKNEEWEYIEYEEFWRDVKNKTKWKSHRWYDYLDARYDENWNFFIYWWA